jgi:transposase
MLYVGVDLHKRYSVMTVIDEKGKEVKQKKLSNEKEEIISFLSNFQDEIEVVVEATSNWYWFSDLLSSKGVSLKLSHPLKTKAIASARIKTDKIDSKILAQLLRCNLLPEAYIPTDKERERRELLRNRAFLVKLRSSLKAKVHALLAKLNIEVPYSDLFGKKGRIFLKNIDISPLQREALESYLRAIDFLDREIAEFSKRVKKMVEGEEKAKVLMTIPGIGYHLSLLILAEIGDINRFPSAKKLVSFAGLCPSTYSSGGKTYHGRIVKQGSKWLRWAMVEAATKVSALEPNFKEFYSKLKRKKGAKVARIAVARKLLENIYHMLKKNECFTQSVKRMEQARKSSGHLKDR